MGGIPPGPPGPPGPILLGGGPLIGPPYCCKVGQILAQGTHIYRQNVKSGYVVYAGLKSQCFNNARL